MMYRQPRAKLTDQLFRYSLPSISELAHELCLTSTFCPGFPQIQAMSDESGLVNANFEFLLRRKAVDSRMRIASGVCLSLDFHLLGQSLTSSDVF
jgi:hypothetical protein